MSRAWSLDPWLVTLVDKSLADVTRPEARASRVAGSWFQQSIHQMVGQGNRQATVIFLLPKLSYINLSTLFYEISLLICAIPN